MTAFAKAVFWISIIYIAYTYAGYPLLLHILARFFPRRVDRRPPGVWPMVSVVIAARDEEAVIGERLENLLAQDYPPGRMEIIVISDGSSDGTDGIASGYARRSGDGAEAPRVIHISHAANRGKPAALNAGLERSSGEIIVFADARQRFERDAVMRLVEDFSDPSVGAVSGELSFREDSDTTIRAEMGLYWDLEKWIRRTESRLHSAAGATGAIYAVRRTLVPPIPENVILDDVLVPMRCVLAGHRNVFETRAVAWDTVSRDLGQEKRRKVRTLLGNYQLVQLMPDLLSPGRNPIFFQFVSHKMLRLFVPLFFIAAMVSSLLTLETGYRAFFVLTSIVLLTPLFADRLPKAPFLHRVAAISKTFTSLNFFAFLAFLKFIRPGDEKIW